ncbi:MAG: cupin domain-containing protein [Verrucomicrobia bacterium]|nr:cupin domain-containing protein [Verrucomicrobiota bacterium]
MQGQPGPELFPGGTSITHLKVYDTVAPDGWAGGSPHMHFACTETYLVVNGRGAVQTLSSEGFREVPLRPGSVVWFTPGLIHRLINEDGKLELFVVMENAGLPEHGDSILTFPPPYLEGQRSYLQVASLSRAGAVFTESGEAARRRRDLAVEGFLALRDDFNRGGLRAFYDRAVRLVRTKEPAWRKIWQAGPVKAARRTETFLDRLRAGASDYLGQGRIFEITADPERERRKLGFCGTLRTYLAEGELVAGS